MTTLKRRADMLLTFPCIVLLILIEACDYVIDEIAELCIEISERW